MNKDDRTWFLGVCALFWLGGFLIGLSVAMYIGTWTAHADDHFYSPIPECSLPDGDPLGRICLHTEPNGKQYPERREVHRHDSELPPTGGEYFEFCTRMDACP